MIPIRDTITSKNYPIVNNTIIGINIILFLVELSRGEAMYRFIYLYGLVPARYSIPEISEYFSFSQQAFALISFMFLHGGFWHLLGNMWSLFIFGDNVEDHLGHLRYLVFYLLCGLTSGLSHLVFNFHSSVPTIGASGAIAGVMGAYVILYPHSKILTLIPIVIIPWFIEIPAFFFLGVWLVLQILNALASHGMVSGIAWWAHIGGFFFGIAFLKLFALIPVFGVNNRVKQMTTKKKTHHLQVVYPVGTAHDPHLYGTLAISPYEAVMGTRKLITIAWGFQKRLFNVTIPAGVRNNSLLRLKNMGKRMPEGGSGDMYLKISIRDADPNMS